MFELKSLVVLPCCEVKDLFMHQSFLQMNVHSIVVSKLREYGHINSFYRSIDLLRVLQL
jgi:hypothetical protein